MQVLLLSPYPETLSPALERAGDQWTASAEPLDGIPRADFIVSYGYRHIVREPVISAFYPRIVNLHISLLPWNRGADPNFWSWVDGTPKGVSIHRMDEGIDTGWLVAQAAIEFTGPHTLATSYRVLREQVETLFAVMWPHIRCGDYVPVKQPDGGSYHRARDKEYLFRQLPLGWDTPVAELASRSAA